MTKITNPSKLLPSAKSTAIVRVGKSNIIAKTSPLSKGLLATRQSKDANDANNKLVKVDKFLKSDLIISQKKAEVKRKDKEKQDFAEAEKKLELPKFKGIKLPSLGLSSLGFMDRVKRFIFFTALGWALPKILEFLPKLQGFANIIGGVYQFAEGLFGKLFNGFMSLVKFGGDLKDKTLGFIATAKSGVGGNYQKEFDKLEKQFNTFVNASIIAGVLAADIGSAAVDEYNKQRKKGQKPEPGKPAAKAGAKVTTGRGGKKLTGKTKVTTGKGDKVPGWWNKTISKLKGGPFAKLSGPFGRFLGAAAPFVGASFGALDAKARFDSGDKIGGWMASTSAALDAFAGGAGLIAGGFLSSVIGAPIAAALGAAAGVATGISMGIDVLLLVRDILNVFGIKTFSRGGRVVKRYQGGGTARGGRPVGGPKRRAITPTRRKPQRVTLPKTQPGKDVGGEKKVKEFYAKPEDPSKKYTRPAGGWLANLGQERKDLSAFDTLKKMSGTLKSDETLAKGILGVMSSGIDIALGQKPDKKVFNAFFNSIGYVADILASQRTNKSMSSLMSQIGAFAEGGTIPSRGLRGTYSDANTGDLLAKLIGPAIDQRVNEAIQSIEKQLQMKGGTSKPAEGAPDAGGPGPGGGPSVESIDMSGLTPEDVDALGRMIQSEAGNQSNAGKAAVMNAILNRYRLAKSGKGYLPRGKTKDNVTIRDLLYAPNQFSPIDDGRFDRTSSASGKSALAQAISAGGNDPEKLKKVLMEKYKLNEQDANYVVVSTAFSNPESRSSRPFGTKEVTVGNHTFQESPYARLNAPGQRIDASVKTTGIIKGGKIKGGAIVTSRGDPDAEQTGMDIALGNYKVGANIQNPFKSLKITGVGVQGSGSGDSGSGYGNYVTGETIINGKRYEVLLGHLDKTLVKKGDILEAGDVIGTQGISGHATGPHVTTHVNALDGGNPSNVLSSIENVWTKGGIIETKSMGEPTSSKKAEKPLPKLGQQKPQAPNPNVIDASSMSGEALFDKIKNIKPGQKIIFNGVGSVQGGKNWFGMLEKKYYDSKGNPITQKQFNDKLRGSKVLEQIHSNDKKVQNMQAGGLISPTKPNRPIPNSFASYETYGSGMMIAIQPIIVEKQVPVSGGGNKMIAFPVPVAVNSNMDNLSFSRG
jgi:murein DD-endopeptidase MepM/ murein hydrolase activator NlpD